MCLPRGCLLGGCDSSHLSLAHWGEACIMVLSSCTGRVKSSRTSQAVLARGLLEHSPV